MTEDKIILEVKVKPNSPKFKIEKKNDQIIIYCKSSPERNKANREIIKELEKLTGCQVRIVGGLTSKKKRIVIDGIAMGSIGGYLGYLIYKKIENTSVVKRIQSE